MLLKLLIAYLNEQDTFDSIYVRLDEKKQRELRKVRLKFNEKASYLPVCLSCSLLLANVARV